MQKDILEELVNKKLSSYKISEITGKSVSTIAYWLKKYQLKTKSRIKDDPDCSTKYCNRCKREKNRSEFYNRRSFSGITSYCKSCTNSQALERQRIFKQKCIDYKGGKCIICNYNKCNAALDFHHLDPNIKDFTIAESRFTKFDNRIKLELDKCILVCSNCHREIHSKLVEDERIELPLLG